MGRDQTKEAAGDRRKVRLDKKRRNGREREEEEKKKRRKKKDWMVKERKRNQRQKAFIQGGQERRRGPRGGSVSYLRYSYLRWSDSGPGQSSHAMAARQYGTWQEHYRYDSRKRYNP